MEKAKSAMLAVLDNASLYVDQDDYFYLLQDDGNLMTDMEK